MALEIPFSLATVQDIGLMPIGAGMLTGEIWTSLLGERTDVARWHVSIMGGHADDDRALGESLFCAAFHSRCRSLARNGPPAMSAIRSLSGKTGVRRETGKE